MYIICPLSRSFLIGRDLESTGRIDFRARDTYIHIWQAITYLYIPCLIPFTASDVLSHTR